MAAQLDGEVDRSRPAEQPDDQVAQAGHHTWAGTGGPPAASAGR
jgi:hypothetical protein